jgi:hypothetical protein
LKPGSTFSVRLVLHGQGLDPASALKGAFDGVVAALQVQRDLGAAKAVAELMAGERLEDAASIGRGLTEHADPALGSVGCLLRAVNARHGQDLRWDPSDSSCIAGEMLVGERGGPLRLDAELIPCDLLAPRHR